MKSKWVQTCTNSLSLLTALWTVATAVVLGNNLATITLPNANTPSLHCILSAEVANVLFVLSDFTLCYHLSKGSTMLSRPLPPSSFFSSCCITLKNIICCSYSTGTTIPGPLQLRHAKAHIIRELHGIEESENIAGSIVTSISDVGEGEEQNPESLNDFSRVRSERKTRSPTIRWHFDKKN